MKNNKVAAIDRLKEIDRMDLRKDNVHNKSRSRFIEFSDNQMSTFDPSDDC